ncbi:MAG: hypothetical protein SCARUB_02074 [Candidatus Scalindua rubra]|uniref:Uncharacterized protein n=1 Tax=Candidatus Scalindua rubra TaxID=1872076 RepID=A0A1E3XAZ1_9BACT|nr:MAG: hypothetical protein SCARUB_02074 [Candidatus Scalindua rubra]
MRMVSQNSKYTSNLQKAGAALEDVKILLKYWKNSVPQKELVKELIVTNVLGKRSRKRTTDVIQCIFLPRYVNGYPKDHWVYLKKLMEANIPSDIIRPLLYFHCALNEPIVKNFVKKVLLERYEKGILEVESQDAYDFIQRGIEDSTIPVRWGDAVRIRVASGLFAALKDFGIIEGGRSRKIAPKFIPMQVFFYIAFFIYNEALPEKKLLIMIIGSCFY